MQKSSPAPDSSAPPDEPQRLSKVVAARVPCSRREAEQYIAEGWVSVDGRVVEEPQARVAAGQQVVVDPRARLQPPEPATLLVHKPAGMPHAQAQALAIAANRWSGDATGIRRTAAHAAGQQPLLVLPQPASGLVVFSQDGRIIRKLLEDAALIEQELVAEVTGAIVPGGLERLCKGLVHEGRPLPPARVSWQSETRLRIAAKGLDADAVPWMCAQVGLQLQALRRLRIGRVGLAGLPVGQWRYLGLGEKF